MASDILIAGRLKFRSISLGMRVASPCNADYSQLQVSILIYSSRFIMKSTLLRVLRAVRSHVNEAIVFGPHVIGPLTFQLDILTHLLMRCYSDITQQSVTVDDWEKRFYSSYKMIITFSGIRKCSCSNYVFSFCSWLSTWSHIFMDTSSCHMHCGSPRDLFLPQFWVSWLPVMKASKFSASIIYTLIWSIDLLSLGWSGSRLNLVRVILLVLNYYKLSSLISLDLKFLWNNLSDSCRNCWP